MVRSDNGCVGAALAAAPAAGCSRFALDFGKFVPASCTGDRKGRPYAGKTTVVILHDEIRLKLLELTFFERGGVWALTNKW